MPTGLAILSNRPALGTEYWLSFLAQVGCLGRRSLDILGRRISIYLMLIRLPRRLFALMSMNLCLKRRSEGFGHGHQEAFSLFQGSLRVNCKHGRK